MEPYISNGDVVVVKHHEDWQSADDRICVVRVNGEVTLKKVTVFSEGEEVLLSPFNKEYSPLLINEDNYGEAYLVGIAIMAITTRSSIRVNPLYRIGWFILIVCFLSCSSSSPVHAMLL